MWTIKEHSDELLKNTEICRLSDIEKQSKEQKSSANHFILHSLPICKVLIFTCLVCCGFGFRVCEVLQQYNIFKYITYVNNEIILIWHDIVYLCTFFCPLNTCSLLLVSNIQYTSEKDEREEMKTAGVDPLKHNISKYLRNTFNSEVRPRKLQNTECFMWAKYSLMKLCLSNVTFIQKWNNFITDDHYSSLPVLLTSFIAFFFSAFL